MKSFIGFFVFCLWTLLKGLEATDVNNIDQIFKTTRNPFSYDLRVKILPGTQADADVLIAFHGMGSDSSVADILRPNPALPFHIIAFNFPDYRLHTQNVHKTTFGTFDEIAPALFVLKKVIADGGIDRVHLYGFSAGGGAVINVLAALNSDRYDSALQKIGIGQTEKKRILQAIQKGSVILEVPLKSFDEIADLYGGPESKIVARRARENEMVPIDNIKQLHNLSLNIFVYFAQRDEAIGNRDDAEYIRRLREFNTNGQTVAIIGRNAGHLTYHPELWAEYKKYSEIN